MVVISLFAVGHSPHAISPLAIPWLLAYPCRCSSSPKLRCHHTSSPITTYCKWGYHRHRRATFSLSLPLPSRWLPTSPYARKPTLRRAPITCHQPIRSAPPPQQVHHPVDRVHCNTLSVIVVDTIHLQYLCSVTTMFCGVLQCKLQ
jgi:hypothetical protein